MLQRKLLHLVIVHAASLLLQVVAHRLIDDAAGVHKGTVAEVTSMIEVQTHKCITRIQAGQEDSGISLSTRVRLNISILCAKKLADTVDGKLLHFVHNLAPAIITLAGIALGIFIGQARAHSCHDLVTYVIL